MYTHIRRHMRLIVLYKMLTLNLLSAEDERLKVQEKAFTNWFNAHLPIPQGSHTSAQRKDISDLYEDLKDGILLLRLIENLSGSTLVSEISKSSVLCTLFVLLVNDIILWFPRINLLKENCDFIGWRTLKRL